MTAASCQLQLQGPGYFLMQRQFATDLDQQLGVPASRPVRRKRLDHAVQGTRGAIRQ
jgi:hypothetical protein